MHASSTLWTYESPFLYRNVNITVSMLPTSNILITSVIFPFVFLAPWCLRNMYYDSDDEMERDEDNVESRKETANFINNLTIYSY